MRYADAVFVNSAPVWVGQHLRYADRAARPEPDAENDADRG
jgi:hypothetical protein